MPDRAILAVDAEAQKSIIFDELILKRVGTIRAPFSLHMTHRWVAVPVDQRRLDAFMPGTDATIRAALRSPRVRLPVNSVSVFQKPPWTSSR